MRKILVITIPILAVAATAAGIILNITKEPATEPVGAFHENIGITDDVIKLDEISINDELRKKISVDRTEEIANAMEEFKEAVREANGTEVEEKASTKESKANTAASTQTTVPKAETPAAWETATSQQATAPSQQQTAPAPTGCAIGDHAWATSTIHHEGATRTEYHLVAYDGFDFTAAGFSNDQILDYMDAHECGYATQPVTFTEPGWDETVTTCSRCGARQ